MARKVGIAEDLPKEIYEWRKSLYELADTLRKEGKKVIFRRDKFIVDGAELTDEQIEGELNQDRTRARRELPSREGFSNNRAKPKTNLSLVSVAQTNIEQFYQPVARTITTFELGDSLQ